MEQIQNNTPPQEPKDILERLGDLTDEVRTLHQVVEAMPSKFKTETQVIAMIQNTLNSKLQDYSTTSQVRRILSDSIAGLNRGMMDGFSDLNLKFDKFVTMVNEKTTRHDSQFEHNANTIELLSQQQKDADNTISLLTSAQESQRTLLRRIDENIRGDGEKNGLTARVGTIESSLPRIESVLTELATIAKTNQQMVLADRERDEKEEKKRQARRDKYERYAIRAIQGILTALITSGGLGTLFLVIGQALTQQS